MEQVATNGKISVTAVYAFKAQNTDEVNFKTSQLVFH